MNSETQAVNRLLAQNGLGRVGDPGLIPQLGFLMGQVITGHEELREFLNKCEPRERVHMLEAVKPYLRFEAKPLDVYVAELGMIADAKQLPVQAPDGTLKPYQVSDIQTDAQRIAQYQARAKADMQAALERDAKKLIADAAATRRLALTCIRCTREEVYSGYDKRDAVSKAREAGWQLIRRLTTDETAELCPLCAAG